MERQLPYVDALFPIAVWQNNIGAPTREQMQFIDSIEWHPLVEGNFGSNRSDLLEEPVFAETKKKILDEVNRFHWEVMGYKDLDLYITISWATANPPSASHHYHYHHNALYSGVYYLDVPDGAPGLRFLKEKHDTFDFNRHEWNRYNATAWDMVVYTGDLVVFPSTLSHQVLKNDTDKTRVVLPFNIWFKGEMGEPHNYTYLKAE